MRLGTQPCSEEITGGLFIVNSIANEGDMSASTQRERENLYWLCRESDGKCALVEGNAKWICCSRSTLPLIPFLGRDFRQSQGCLGMMLMCLMLFALSMALRSFLGGGSEKLFLRISDIELEVWYSSCWKPLVVLLTPLLQSTEHLEPRNRL